MKTSHAAVLEKLVSKSHLLICTMIRQNYITVFVTICFKVAPKICKLTLKAGSGIDD